MSRLSEEKLLKFIGKSLKESKRFFTDWRREAYKDYGYYSGDHWDQDTKRQLMSTGRMPIEFNYISRLVNALTGMEIENRTQALYKPQSTQDTEMADMLNQLKSQIDAIVDAEDEHSEAFSDASISGMGWTERHIDFTEDLDGCIKLSRIDPMEMLWDKNSKKRNLKDARWIARVLELTKQQVEELFPNMDEIEAEQFWNDSQFQPHNDELAEQYLSGPPKDMDDKKVNVSQFQWWELEDVYRVSINGKERILSSVEYRKLQKRMADEGTSIQVEADSVIKQKKKTYHQVFYANDMILNKEDGPSYDSPINGFSFACVTGFRDRNNNTWYGIVRMVRTVQMLLNKLMTQILRIVDTNAKGGLYAEFDAFQNPQVAEQEISREDSIVFLNPGGLQKILPKNAPDLPPGILTALEFTLRGIIDIPGISMESMGVVNRQQPAMLEAMRKESTITILATLFNSLKYYRKEDARHTMDFVRRYFGPEKVFDILNGEHQQSILEFYDDEEVIYNVVIDDQPNASTVKQRNFAVINQIIPMALQAGVPIPPDVLDYTPLPATFVEKWKKMIQGNQEDRVKQEQIQQLQLMMQQLELQGKQVDNFEKQTQAELNLAKSEKERALALDETAQAQQKTDIDVAKFTAEQQLKEQAMLNEQVRKDVEMLLEQRRKALLQTEGQ